MISQQELMNKFVQRGTQIWSSIETESEKRVNSLKLINQGLRTLATPKMENNVKVEIVRQTCKKLKQLYPRYAEEVDAISLPFEHHLKFDQMAVLPFKQIDSLTFRIFINQNMISFLG